MRNIKFEYKITAVYLILGGLWILFSDNLLYLLFNDREALTQMQTYKGWFYVVITALLLYSLLKKHLVKLRSAEQKAVENDRLKTAFMQNISHEIRTPMNGIIGFAGLLKSETLSEEQKSQYLDIIIKSSEQLLTIVNAVLDMSLIESGTLSTLKSNVNLNEIMDDVYQANISQINRGITFSIRKGLKDKESNITTDNIKIRQVLQNLLSNAIKFTEQGSIELGYSLKGNELEFYIKDTGIGIDSDMHNEIFNRFFQTEKGIEKLYEGVGLGLAICKGNIDLLKGRIWLESEPGKGSTFFFTIPYIPTTNEDENIDKKDENAQNMKETSILIVEDEESNFLYIKELFEGTGVVILHAKNGKEAVDMCLNHNNINLILMDLKMPVMNGFEATKLIRELYPGLPIVAQSAFALGEEREKALKAGCNEYISKPFKKEELMALLNSLN